MGVSGVVNEADASTSRALELQSLLKIATHRLVSFVGEADREATAYSWGKQISKSALLDGHPPRELAVLMQEVLSMETENTGLDGFSQTLESLLKYSVNTSSPGFLDKLYSAPLPPGIAAELILAVLNTNVHVYQVSPALTLIEKYVTKELAKLFGLNGPRAGGISVQGGSASNTTSIVVARNTLYPRTKTHGNSVDGLDLALFTSAHGHYSIEKAAQQCGLGSSAVIAVPVDPITGQMVPEQLSTLIEKAKSEGKTPFYVNATAGTTVLGSFDPFTELSAIAKANNMWLHIDGAWGGSFALSDRLRNPRLCGSHLADSIAVNPHKMMGVPVTCSFLLAKDLKQFHEANTLKAGYLFHDSEDSPEYTNGTNGDSIDAWREPQDLADMTLQCGRRGDSLKLFMSWQYYGTAGYQQKIDAAYEAACNFADLVASCPDLLLVSTQPPPCLQVCFYYAPGKKVVYGTEQDQIQPEGVNGSNRTEVLGKRNSRVTEQIVRMLIQRGFMIDFAPALEGQEDMGKFFRAVVNISTPSGTVERLVDEIRRLGQDLHQRIAAEQTR